MGFFAKRSAQSYMKATENNVIGSACGAGDKEPVKEPEKKPSACGSACGAGDKEPVKEPEKKPSACGSACGAGNK